MTASRGGGRRRLLKPDEDVSIDDLQAFVKRSSRPTSTAPVWFADELPKTAYRKILKRDIGPERRGSS